MTKPNDPAARMRCPTCGTEVDKVIDSRPVEGTVRRRRMCRNGHRIVTVEHILGSAAS